MIQLSKEDKNKNLEKEKRKKEDLDDLSNDQGRFVMLYVNEKNLYGTSSRFF